MSLRISLARYLLRLGAFIQSLPVVIMKPDELIEFSRQTYSQPNIIQSFSEDSFIDQGLSGDEAELISQLESTEGDLLLLGIGGGREAISFSKMGFSVTGVDFVAGMVNKAIKNANARGNQINGMVQDISKLSVPSDTYDVVWLSLRMFSSIPTRKKRVEMVKRIKSALKPGGVFLCQFYWESNRSSSRILEFSRRIASVLSLGNLRYEAGDILWRNAEFIHVFSSEDAIRNELEEGGFTVVRVKTNSIATTGNVICRKG